MKKTRRTAPTEAEQETWARVLFWRLEEYANRMLKYFMLNVLKDFLRFYD